MRYFTRLAWHRLHHCRENEDSLVYHCIACGAWFGEEAIEDRKVKPCRRRRLPEPTVHHVPRYTKAEWRAEVRGARFKNVFHRALGRIWKQEMDPSPSVWLDYIDQKTWHDQ